MTYGWAILIVIIVAAALFALGVFNPATYTQSTATGFTGFQIPSGGWQFTSSGVLTLQLKNMAGANINITSIQATYAGASTTNSTGSDALGAGSSYTAVLTFPGVSPAQGSTYSIDVKITYKNLDTGISGFISSGTMTGTVS